MNNSYDKNNISISSSIVLLIGFGSGVLGFYPISMMLLLWFFVTLFMTEALDDDILSVLNSKHPFMVGSKMGFFFSLIVFAIFNLQITIPVLVVLGALKLFLDHIYKVTHFNHS